jgi:hypothetical protein
MKLESFRGIWNCPTLSLPLLSYECPQSWDALPETADPTLRHCPACKQVVRLCQTPEEFIEAGERGECVAIPKDVLPIRMCGYRVGRPSRESVAEDRADMLRFVRWWSGVIQGLPNALGRQLQPMRKLVQRKNEEAEVLADKLASDWKGDDGLL